MALQGTLREFSATDILQLLATQKKTGCLILELSGQELSQLAARMTETDDVVEAATNRRKRR